MNRRKFATASVATAIGSTLPLLSSQTGQTAISDINIVGPKEGYTAQVGTLVSMMNWMREVVIRQVRGMSVKELDFLLDEDSNSIGSMLWHLAEVERFYQRRTFGGIQWDALSASENSKWSAASSLGSGARRLIKGYDIDFYVDLLTNVRNFSLEEFKKRDDQWLMTVDNNFWGSPTNYYCMWFHVAEHESNHNGQIKYIQKRVV